MGYTIRRADWWGNGWEIYIGRYYWTSTFTKAGARRVVRKATTVKKGS